MMSRVSSSTALAEAVSCYAAVLLGLMLMLSCCEPGEGGEVNMNVAATWPCDEIYVVREGETLHTISEKCGDPYIVEENPHIHDPDDVFPGLVIKITPFNNIRI
ncbi:peptidoglycan-binding LysM domain-containing protein [Perilla frutescens var. hirtella]|uniref:Peptidoglycan-binding LysM domain-containing protein n=1 Tax=Perilla frutescens var. hirtella TaxID=608512 RepID=A0AAD4JCB8_PERFH|nr:peptidoglycan-binding LysM domain-containing protein [Perilla frutescens var. hirtella]KAH6806103.1 peptidoglycan-binding LysM domain-containing protein [Perilla frutescens var. frutescens]KAH6830520.1 peptidoglycan-binding LysM domain-containing protein [Perilla frutescens var. hirtella]